jgi:L,D-transpeptidase ErfK/SrfK
MRRIIDLSLLSNWLRLIALSIFIVSFHGCAGLRGMLEKPSPFPMYTEDYLEKNEFSVTKGNDVVGRLAVIKVENGDTLPDIARHFSVGINAISARIRG